ncbi:MAG: YdcF family protein [Candidatus Doudnabacteria bacterium]|nr:YdcF family protein [Candidatus Doudnabacteria bacterium]
MNNIPVEQLAKKIWEYHHLNHKLSKADCILVLGSHDIRVAVRAAELFLEGYAPLMVFSGGYGRLTQGLWNEPEAIVFSKIAIEMGVPKDQIIIEDKSTNTGENIVFTKKLLEEKGINPKTIILVQKPYMERRAYATFKKFWPEKDCIATSQQVSFDDYPTKDISKDDLISILVGDLQRIKTYPEKGFQIHQEIPDDVWSAYELLVKAGYNKYLTN